VLDNPKLVGKAITVVVVGSLAAWIMGHGGVRHRLSWVSSLARFTCELPDQDSAEDDVDPQPIFGMVQSLLDLASLPAAKLCALRRQGQMVSSSTFQRESIRGNWKQKCERSSRSPETSQIDVDVV